MSDSDVAMGAYLLAGVVLRVLAGGVEGVPPRRDGLAPPPPSRTRRWMQGGLRWLPLAGFVLAMSAAGGAVVPLWIGLLAALPITVLGRFRPLVQYPLTAIVTETATVAVMLGIWSAEGFGFGRTGLVLLVSPIASLGGWLMARAPLPRSRTAISNALVVGTTAIAGALVLPRLWGPAKQGPAGILNLSWMAPAPAGRVVLDDGSVAWAMPVQGNDPALASPEAGRSGPGRVAILFHGANPEGSLQPTAVILQHALLAAGFSVLAVDAPGYGHSPLPTDPDQVESWHPSRRTSAAIRAAQDWRPGAPLVLVGHSMGCRDVVFALADDAPVEAAVLFGASWFPPDLAEDFWHARFHEDRGLDPGRFSADFVRELRRRYSLGIVGSLAPDHPPVTFVAFGYEHDDVQQWRTRVYEELPGPKLWVDLPGIDHAGNAIGVRGLVLGEAGALDALTDVARSLAVTPAPVRTPPTS